MTKKEAIENHRAMWLWMAKETLKRKHVVTKHHYFLFHSIPAGIKNYCFCCEYAARQTEVYEQMCIHCPLLWPGGCCINGWKGDGGLFAEWNNCSIRTDYRKAALLAYKISKLPENQNGKEFYNF